jgi:mono/diheme cytochrome c family protein
MRRIAAPLLLALAGAGCSSTSSHPPVQVFNDMKHQPKYLPQGASPLFSDGRASRPPVPGTVARGQLRADPVFYTGIHNGNYVVNPLPLDMQVMKRGQERFDVYCAPCHDRTGAGKGIVAQRSSWLAASLHEPRIREMADGELFDTITHGKRTMPGYRFQIPERDRWSIVAYVRALQRATGGTVSDVPQELRSELR